MYKLIIWKAIWTDSGPETSTDSYILNYKPTFDDMYKHLSTDMIEISKGYDKNISNRSFVFLTITGFSLLSSSI